MHVVWRQGESTVGSVRDYLGEQAGGKKPPHSTISTMLRILSDKGFLRYRTYGRTNVYEPVLSKEQYSKQSLRRLVTDYFGGSVNRLVSFLVREEDLSLEELTDLIDQLEKEEE